jgi:hypothetical protein
MKTSPARKKAARRRFFFLAVGGDRGMAEVEEEEEEGIRRRARLRIGKSRREDSAKKCPEFPTTLYYNSRSEDCSSGPRGSSSRRVRGKDVTGPDLSAVWRPRELRAAGRGAEGRAKEKSKAKELEPRIVTVYYNIIMYPERDYVDARLG